MSAVRSGLVRSTPPPSVVAAHISGGLLAAVVEDYRPDDQASVLSSRLRAIEQ